MRGIHTTAGYRDGVASSKEKYLQDGFDEGYMLGAELGAQAGRLIGVLEGIVSAEQSDTERCTNSAMNEEDVGLLLQRARTELDSKSLYGREYFHGDGVWKYCTETVESPGERENESVTFRFVASSHPLIQRWDGIIRNIAMQRGLTF